MELRLHKHFGGLERQLRQARLWRKLALCWAAAAGVELVLLVFGGLTGVNLLTGCWLAVLAGLLLAGVMWWRERQRPADFRALVAVIASENAEVRHLLLTALEQEPHAQSGELSFLQWRVIDEAATHPDTELWIQRIYRSTASANTSGIIALAAMMLMLAMAGRFSHSRWLAKTSLAAVAAATDEIVVTPGDTQIERGSGLVISARFGGAPPPEATLVMVPASGKAQRLPLERTLADPIFGASLLEVAENEHYHIEYAGKATRDYQISVFDYPALTRADAELAYPSYTGLTNKTIPDTLRVSALEGTRLTYKLQLNKPVFYARLIGPDQSLPLTVQTNAVAMLNAFPLTISAHYLLELVDADGRTNKLPSEFVFQALPDRPPEVSIIFPHGDQRVSRLQEMEIQGRARGNFGLLKYGLGFGVTGQDPQFVELGRPAGAGDTRQFTNVVALEKLAVDVDQVVSYFAWADDYGPDGKVRRTFSDIFFAEVRPFEEVFRADQSGESAGQQQNQGGQSGGKQPAQLAELEKQIMIATWKLRQTKTAVPKENQP